MSVIRRRAVATPPGVLRNLVVVLVVAASAWLGVDSAYADFTLRCYDWRDRAPWAARVYVSEGDQFVINLKWNEYSAGRSWVAEWNTQRGSGGTATSDTDYEPRDDHSQTKRTADNMNHTFSTVEDDRYEGDETYEAGYSFAGGGSDIDRHEYCPVTIEDDPRRSDNIFIEDDDPHAKLESAQIDGATVTLTFDRAIDRIEVAGPGDPDHDPGYLPLPPRSYFTMWRRGGTAPAWAGAPGVPLNVAWRSTGPGPAAGTGASSFVLTARTVTVDVPRTDCRGRERVARLPEERKTRPARQGDRRTVPASGPEIHHRPHQRDRHHRRRHATDHPHR